MAGQVPTQFEGMSSDDELSPNDQVGFFSAILTDFVAAFDDFWAKVLLFGRFMPFWLLFGTFWLLFKSKIKDSRTSASAF